MTRILIAEPNPSARSAFALLLSHKLGLVDIHEAGDVDQLIRTLANYPPDILLLDWLLYGAPALEMCRLLRKAYPMMKIVLLSVNPDDSQPSQDVGAIFIQKGASPEEVLSTLKHLLLPE